MPPLFTLRPTRPEETGRLHRFLPGAFPEPPGVRWLVAVALPERFVAAAAVWPGHPPEDDAKFLWCLTPRAGAEDDAAVARTLLASVRETAAAFPGAPALRTAVAWAESSPTSRLLAAAGAEVAWRRRRGQRSATPIPAVA